MLEFTESIISFTKSIKRIGELGSPCFRPICESKKCENEFLYLIQSLTVAYIDSTAFTNLTLTFSFKSFCHRKVRSTLSKHFSKSKKAQ